MKQGSIVILTPTTTASEEFREKVAALGDVAVKVLAKTGIGVCTLLLPKGVTISGHSHPLPETSPFPGQHYLDLAESHLTEVS